MKHETWKEIHNYCMEKPCAYESRPFGQYPICYRIAGKIFAQLSPEAHWFKITLKTNPDAADFYRSAFPGVVVRGYHCPQSQQPYWNTIELNGIDRETLFQMIDEAYDEVLKKLPKKEQKRLPQLSDYRFEKTNGENPDFAKLCEMLDRNLDEVAGTKIDRTKYEKYNLRDSIQDAIVIYRGGEAVGCGAYKLYDGETAELKRIYIKPALRGLGLGKELLRRLEADARIAGFRYAVLETGELLTAAMALYQKAGYKIIPNYGQYADMPESICMSRKI